MAFGLSEIDFSDKDSYLEQAENCICSYYRENANGYHRFIEKHRYCYNRQVRLLNHLIPQPGRVLEIGCGLGQNLVGLDPEYGLGIDICSEMVDAARAYHPESDFPNIEFRCLSAANCASIDEKFDTILLVNIITEIPDIVAMFKNIRHLCTPETRIVHLTFNYRWELVLKLGAKFGVCQKHPAQNWLSQTDYENIFELADLQLVKEGFELLFPLGIPVLSDLLNRFGSVVPFLRTMGMMHYGIIRPIIPHKKPEDFSVSVVVPCKDEEGNIEGLVQRIPDMGKGTEIIFVDDKSVDSTNENVRAQMKAHPEKNIKLVDGPGLNKGSACRAGFAQAQNDILMILDADMTVMPEALPEFFEAITTGKGEFINGSRLVYPLQGMAMKSLNILGNKAFAMMFSFLLSQPIKDTLCGTKVIWRHDYESILEARKHFGCSDRWGDYDWIFGANRHNLRIIELPVHYVERTAGETKMSGRFNNGWVMLKMCNLAFWRMKIL